MSLSPLALRSAPHALTPLLAGSLLALAAVGCGSSVSDGGGGSGGGGAAGGTCGDDSECYSPDDCVVGGVTYADGDTVPGECADCSCSDGEVLCPAIACVATCEHNGQVYQAGESFPLGDGCNSCFCEEDGSVACTGAFCGEDCVYAGVTYTQGASFPALDGCNTCSCEAGGLVACTEIACACNPADEWWRDYVAQDPDQCAVIDYVCPANTTPFANSCGCGCEQDSACPEWFDCMPPSPCDPEQIAIDCPYSGIAY
jgi:hypothetical protein